MDYIIHYDIAAVMIMVTVMLHFFIKKNIDSTLTRLYSALVICAFAAAALDILDCYTTSHFEEISLWIVYVVKSCYLIVFNACAFLYYGYLLHATNAKKAITLFQKIIWIAPFAVEIIIIVLSPLTKLAYYFDNQQHYQYGPFMMVLYGLALFYVVFSMLRALRYHSRLTATQQASVFFFTLSTIVTMIIQIKEPELMLTPFAVAISVLLIYLSLENPQTYEDKLFGCFNREAFVDVVSSQINEKKQFFVIGIQLDGMKYINNAVGVDNGNVILREVSEFLMGIRRKVFHISGVRFAMILDDKNDDEKEIVRDIRKRFDRSFFCQNVEIHLSVFMCTINYPDDVTSIEDIIDTIEYSLKEISSEDNGVIVNAGEEVLERKRRENYIIQLLKKSVAENSFEVYYQPIFSVERGCFTCAEALVRLHDDELGYISPEEFIPLAEQHGLILQIGEFVFKTVCSFIISNSLYKCGIEYIEVNLSMVQCMQKDLYDRMIHFMDAYNIPHEMINFEITETAASVSNEILVNNMAKLIDAGSNFSMDDYGTGFSNASSMIDLPFSYIKIDKSIVWSAMSNEKAMCVLKYNTAMIKAMNRYIIAEGVETQEQADILEKLGCDFFQGFYYSRPVPGEEFIKVINRH